MKCNICNHESKELFDTKVLSKYQVKYYQCEYCGFIQTEKPYWLNEAYENAIAGMDVGLIYRNIEFSNIIFPIITTYLDYKGKFLDYAGGYGMFTRIMRDKGLNYYHYDKYCENLFAKNFELQDTKITDKFEAVTALEVFEHFDNPLEDIKKLLTFSDTIIFSTELIPDHAISTPNDWWYFTPESGQHVSFYSKNTFKYIGHKLHLNYYTNGQTIHIITKNKFISNPFENSLSSIRLESLLNKDFEKTKKKINYTSHPQNQKIVKNEITSNTIETLKLITKFKKLTNILKKENTDYSILITQKNEEIKSITSQLQSSVDQLHKIYSSFGWRTLRHIYQIRDLLITPLKLPKKIINKLLCKIEDIRPRPKIASHRHINLQSKKVVYIGHSYHAKTKSTGFLLDYLKENFEVTEILDDSWQGKPFPDLSFIDRSYLAVIFFQNLPDKEIFDQINNDNLIFFPMYDSYGSVKYDYWQNYKKLKIVNFSKTLHKKLTTWGFESIYAQFFPQPFKFSTTRGNRAFYWQRTNQIDINTVEKLLGNADTKIHFHQAIDPNCTLVRPTLDQEKKFGITYSDWFPSREDMQKILDKCNIYIAPREYEGIGMSFLEAMAMGKAVVAPNNPTMNEYITNNYNGYLYDVHHPHQIDFSNIDKIRANTCAYMQKGYSSWLNERKKIIKFLIK